jgi:GTP-binding protein
VVYIDEHEFVLADIPGLIEGASEGRGLGDRFLRHVERCGVLLHLIDSSAEDVVENYRVIRGELAGYSEELITKTEIVALNKIDLLSEEELKEKTKKLQAFIAKQSGKKQKVFTISAATSKGVKEVLRALYKNIEEYRGNEK